MSDDGVFAVHRGVFKHPFFAPEPYTEREAWIWLLGNAAWRKMRTRSGRALVDLERGQLAYATRFMAGAWKWPEARVRRFLKRAKNDAMIVVQTTRETTLITICNYDEYQFTRRTDDAQPDALPTHDRRKEEEVKEVNKEEIKKEPSLRSARANVSRETLNPDWPDDGFEQFYAAYPRKVDRLDAAKAFEKVCKKHRVPWAKLMAAVSAYAATADPQFTKHPATWLNKGGWANQQGGSNGQRPSGGARQSGGADFFAGLASVAADIAGDGPVAGPAGEEIPFGRVNIDG